MLIKWKDSSEIELTVQAEQIMLFEQQEAISSNVSATLRNGKKTEKEAKTKASSTRTKFPKETLKKIKLPTQESGRQPNEIEFCFSQTAATVRINSASSSKLNSVSGISPNFRSCFSITALVLQRMQPNRNACARMSLLGFGCVMLLLNLLSTPTAVLAGCRLEKPRACEAICSPSSNGSAEGQNCTIRALVLLPDNETYVASLRGVLPLLKVTEKKLHEVGIIPRHISFKWMPHDDKCDASYAVIEAMDGIVKNCAHVIFGPVCDYSLAAVGRITKYFNVDGTPLITVGGSTSEFEKQKTTCTDEFYMVLRAGMLSFESMSQLIIDVMKRNDWSHSVFFYEPNGQSNVAGEHTCFLMMNSLGKQMRKENMTFAQFPMEQKLSNRTMEMEQEIGNKHSIVIMCADPKSIRQIMLTAEELNMIDSGEYVFINIELFSRVPHITSQPWYDKNDTQQNNERAKKAYTAMLTVTPKQPSGDEYTRISNRVKAIAASKYNYTFHENEPISAFVTSFFDGVLLYAKALNESITEDPTMLTRPINGTDMVRRMWNRNFTGITGNVTIDANGDRISAYSLLDMNPETGRFEIVADFLHNRLEYVPGKVIHWAGNRLEAPPDRPKCGYDGSLCPDTSLPGYAILSIVLSVVVVIMLVCFFFGYRHYKSEADINSMSWRVTIDDVMWHDAMGRGICHGSFHSLVKQSSQITLMSDDMVSFSGDRQIFIPVGIFRGCKVAIKAIEQQNINLTRQLMLELKRMKDLQHDHLVKFYGACLDPPKSFLLTEYCPKGSLQDILENEQFQLDFMFKLSLMHDIVRGMQFLHSSDIKSHGNLKSSNCVVDSRFVLKITDFGMHTLRKPRYHQQYDVEHANSHAYWSKLLWTAPELLKMEENRPPEGTQKGDVYSFGIIVHEITTRQGPFYLGSDVPERPPQEIIELVSGYPRLTHTPFRPQVDDSSAYTDINSIMVKCWAEDPTERPDFNSLKTIIRKINKDNETGNIVDNLLKRMEQYANNLEELVEERTQDYLEEKKKCEKLLYQLLPQSVAAQLISGQPVVAETFDQVTIYFSDIVGFTALSAESTPMQVVQFLNDLYTCFDSIVENFDVYKVETIGDAYMVVSGLPIRNGNQHAREIARLALALLDAVHNFKIHHRPDDRLKLRIGLHTGACVAGVVGLKMPRYCLFGDTVNTASRMESNGEALKIHISEKTKLALDEFGSFITTRRGHVPMKGKGEMLTYWLEGEVPKSESPLSREKLMLTRRTSLKHPRHKQSIEISPLASPHLHQASLGSTGRSYQNSPNLRVKRKISSSSPKLNGGDFKTEDLQQDVEINRPAQSEKTRPRESVYDIYSSRSLRGEPSIKDNLELANFRLPLSGALRNHNNNHSKTNHGPVMQSNSNSNLSGVLQPMARLRLKQSPTITTLMTQARADPDSASLRSGNYVHFRGHEVPVELGDFSSGEEGGLELEEVEDGGDYQHTPLGSQLNNQLNNTTSESGRLMMGGPNNLNLSTGASSNYNNIVKANNVRNFKNLCINSSNNLSEERGNVVTQGKSTLTQPLLAKINS